MIAKVKGFADLLSPQSLSFTHLEDSARRVFSSYGYKELRIPVVEKTELFCRSIGEETDVVQKEMYTFPDRKGRSLTLRPEATAGIMRAFIENKVYARENVTKCFTFGPMFRYERPQKGRMRQFHQINAECLGPDSPYADAEVIHMLWSFLSGLGIADLSLELNSLGCAACRPVYNQALNDFFAAFDAAVLCDDCQRRMGTNPLRVLDCKVPACREATQNAPRIADHICAPCRDHFGVVTRNLTAAELSYALNPRLVRGLDYYTRTTFEVASGKIGAQSAVAGGGRYDGLVKQLGGPDIPGIGFACGMERLVLLLPDTPSPVPDFFLAALDQSALDRAFLIASALRDAGFNGDFASSGQSLKSLMRQANKLNARVCLLLGADELAANAIQVKNMQNGEQIAVPLSDMPALVKRLHAILEG